MAYQPPFQPARPVAPTRTPRPVGQLVAALPDDLRAKVAHAAPALDVDSTSTRDCALLMAALTKGTLQGALDWGDASVGFRDVLWFFGFTERAVAEGKPLEQGVLPLMLESDEFPDASEDLLGEIQRAAVRARGAILNDE